MIAGGIGLAVMAVGILAMALGQLAAGATLSAMALAGLIALRLKQPKPEVAEQAAESDLSRTNLWRPYRTAVNKPTQELYESLSNLEGQVAKVARDEGWPVNWSQHSAAIKASVESRLEKRFAKGLRDVGRAIDLLMTALYTARRAPRQAAVPERGGAA